MPETTVNEPVVVNTATAVEPTAPVPEPDFKAEAETLRTEKKTLEENFKALQRKFNQAQAKGEITDSLLNEMKSTKKYITAVYSAIKQRMEPNAANDYSEPALTPKQEDEVDKLVREEELKEAEAKRTKQEIDDFISAITEAGIPFEDEELSSEMNKYSPKEALKKLPAFIVKRYKREQDTMKQKTEQEKKEASVRDIEKSGALAIDKSSPTASGVLTLEQIKRMTPDEIVKNAKELAKMKLTL